MSALGFSRTRTSTTCSCQLCRTRPAQPVAVLTLCNLPSFNDQTTVSSDIIFAVNLHCDLHSLTKENHETRLFGRVVQVEQDDQLNDTVGQDGVERDSNQILVLLSPVTDVA